MTLALAASPDSVVNEQISNLFNYFNKLEEFEDTVIELLPFASDEQVVQARTYARAMGKAGWRIECACDAVLSAHNCLVTMISTMPLTTNTPASIHAIGNREGSPAA